jgi:hypothetical protein
MKNRFHLISWDSRAVVSNGKHKRVIAAELATNLNRLVFCVPREFDSVVDQVDYYLREAIVVHVDRGLIRVTGSVDL